MIRINPLKEEHLEDAAILVSKRYVKLREQEPLLPDRYQEASNWLPLLQKIINIGGPGVAAIQNGRLVGFLIGWLMPDFRGKRSVYSPEWANAAELDNSKYTYEEMYQKVAIDWVADKYVAHYISMFANDLKAIDAWHWLGFGMTAVDAICGLESIKSPGIQVDIRRAGIQDINRVIELHEGLRWHARGSPDFFISEKINKKYFEKWLDASDRAVWLASVNDEPVAFIRIGPANDNVCTIIIDEKTTSIYRAFTQETMRGKNIGTALLAYVMESARREGYERCAVDFEPMNVQATRFWLGRGFRPVCLSLVRYIDERVV